LHDLFGSQQHIMVPKPNDTPSITLQPFGASVVVSVLEVLAPIQFDDELAFQTREIGEVGTDRMLTPEFATEQPSVAQPIPEPLLRVRLPAP
jgi:hypothetical protein